MVRGHTLQYPVSVPQCEIANSAYLPHQRALEEKAGSMEYTLCLQQAPEVIVKCPASPVYKWVKSTYEGFPPTFYALIILGRDRKGTEKCFL